MASYNPQLKGRRQQDAYECFQTITRGLEAESAKLDQTIARRKDKELSSRIVENWTCKDVIDWLKFHKVDVKKYTNKAKACELPLISGKELGPVLKIFKGQ